MNSRLLLKQELLDSISKVAQTLNINPQYPITDTLISRDDSLKIEKITLNLEALNPFPKPLVYGVNLLDGIWQLNYSTAREIRSLNKLPLGLKLRQVYQIIDTQKTSFFNVAFVEHSSGLVKGYVKVTATFSPQIKNGDLLPQDTINVNFDKRFLAIQKIVNIKTPIFEPVKVFNARNPQGRIPSLKVTYIDESMRIGRGGDGSLFILSKVNKIADS
ncbi:PAP/fibrillin family protein [Cyanobacterium aponinum UTEX 3222]|uniref:PAP/fibrillin family protein n=1 Tax=Cyanobacterium aponinum TaxID=379064 RepID=UPI002B4BED45|nr:PAP/fibrillin family protein [Cyanobacterium aponinum]WRL38304.1 PAP/fibrillin family protein [Cyanobacterium aponinum UTEX 3221]WRL41211.1 PAP/fibrillin family protein [Cyanobacterium aponinum UTEX 3222]